MRLKRLEDILWEDLPKIETPFFARDWVESNLHGEGPLGIGGLDEALWGDFEHHQPGLSSDPPEMLLEKVRTAEIFLLHDLGTAPFAPIVKRHERTGLWELTGTYSLEVQFNLQRMLEHAAQSQGIWEPIAKSVQAPPAPEPKKATPQSLEVTNPQWEHLDGDRGQASPDSTVEGDQILLKVDVSGASDGTAVSFKVYDTAASPAVRVGSVRGEVDGGVGSAPWTVKVNSAGPKLEFEGAVRRVSSGRAEIPLVAPPLLRLGVFFDGTDNDMSDPDTFSNVAKLFEAYDADDKSVFALYKRGVGTDGGIFNDRDGAAFGNGAEERILGMLWDIQERIEAYHKENGQLPKRIVLDIFGFSRGAATARWFVNVIKQGVYVFKEPYDKITPQVFSINFLGVFDTVGSFGLPGNNIDWGTCFHIKPAWIDGRVVQLVADDEHRANFDIQTLLKEQKDTPVDIEKGCLFERVLPGAHADVGGGYGSGRTHGRTGNQLGRIHLHRMHQEASTSGVPLKDVERQVKKIPAHWSIDEKIGAAYRDLMRAYETHPGLQRDHKILRELQRGLEWAEYKLDRLENSFYWGNDLGHALEVMKWEKAIKSLRTRLQTQNRTVTNHFATQDEASAFFETHNQIYAGHVHRSHAPTNDGIGMSPEVHDDGRLQREVFFDLFDKLGEYEPEKFDD